MRHFPLRKKISHVFEYLLVLGFYAFVNIFPWRSLHSLAVSLSYLFYPVLGSVRRRIRNNLELVYPQWDARAIDRLARVNLRHTLRLGLEFFQSWKFESVEFGDRYVRLARPEILDIFRNRPRAFIAVQGHFGNWELPVIYMAKRGVPITFSLKRQSNPMVDKFIWKLRARYGCNMVAMEDSAQLVKDIRQGRVIGLAADQDAGPGGVFVPFMGRPASTFPGPALLGYLTGADIWVGCCLFRGKGVYEIDIRHAGRVDKSAYPTRDAAIETITAQWSQTLTDLVNTQPEQYFWVHRRWKHRPASV